jgi:hypothetical protein
VLLACAFPSHPGPTPTATPTGLPTATSAPPSASPTASPAISKPVATTASHTTTSTRPAARGDLTITLGGGCTWYLDTDSHLWLNPTLLGIWTGPAPWPPNAFSMTANYGKHTAGGLVPESTGYDTDPDPRRARFTWAIGGEAPSVFAGHTVLLTVKIDVVGPLGEVAETNESNNTSVIRVTVPASGYSTTESPVPCALA